jgi:hypothetical protein
MATLTGSTIASTYTGLLSVSGAVGADTVEAVTDGAGTSTSLSLSQQRATITLGSGAADDFIISATKFVVEGDTGNIGIGTATPLAGNSYASILNIDGTKPALLITEAGRADSFISLWVDGGNSHLQFDHAALFSIQTTTDAVNSSPVTIMEFDANSRISLSNNDSSNTSNTIFGKSAWNNSSNNNSDYNTIFGEGVMGTGAVAGATYNVGIGYKALTDLTTGDYNVCVGALAGENILTGDENTAIGHEALAKADGDESGNTAVGAQALFYMVGDSINANTAIGTTSQFNNITGTNNTSVGYNSMKGATGQSNSSNTAVGKDALVAVTTGSWNTVMGQGAGKAITDGHENVIIGQEAGDVTTSVGYSVIIGAAACGGGNMTSDADGTVAIGYQSLAALTSGADNTAIGYQAADALDTGASNVVIGSSALGADQKGARNVAIGNSALGLQVLTSNTETKNVGIGMFAGYNNVTGVNNVYVGYAAGNGASGESNSGNTAVGKDALLAITSGVNNVVVGALAGDAMTDNDGNIVIGKSAFSTANTGEDYNVVIGTDAGTAIDHADTESNVLIGQDAGTGGGAALIGCIAIGRRAMNSTAANAQTGTIAIGHDALTAVTSGSGNTAVGYQAILSNTDGANNTAVGHQCMIQDGGSNAITSPDQCTFIGRDCRASSTTPTNQTVIGYEADGVADNSVTLGNENVTAVYMAHDKGATVYCNGLEVAAGVGGAHLKSGYIATFFNDGDNDAYRGIAITCGQDNPTGTNYAMRFADGDDTEQGVITFSGGTVAYGTFTANHDIELPESDNDDGYPYGTLVEHTEIFYKQKNGADTERGILYKAQKSSSAYSKSVLGAYAGKYPTDTHDNLHQVYVLGDGHILCNGEKGNIEVGDGICTSSTDGEGMKADQMAMIIGIAQEDVSFSGDESKLVVVQYGLQQFTPWT